MNGVQAWRELESMEGCKGNTFVTAEDITTEIPSFKMDSMGVFEEGVCCSVWRTGKQSTGSAASLIYQKSRLFWQKFSPQYFSKNLDLFQFFLSVCGPWWQSYLTGRKSSRDPMRCFCDDSCSRPWQPTSPCRTLRLVQVESIKLYPPGPYWKFWVCRRLTLSAPPPPWSNFAAGSLTSLPAVSRPRTFIFYF